MRHRLDSIFYPKSIAVIGASRNPNKVGSQILHNLIQYGYQGTLYPVNYKAKSVHSIKAYPNILDVPDDVDLAVIVVPSEYALEVMEECGQKGVKGAVVITAGFKEVGGKGVELEEKLHDITKKHGIAMIGPNCMGVINTHKGIKMDATFAPALPLEGRIAFMSQSGALGVAILDYAQNLKIGFSKFVSLGNKTDVSGNDLLEYWGRDAETEVILMYIESFGNPRNFTRIARKVTQSKPIVALKSGRTEAGRRAAVSHTGSLAGLDEATDALFEQCGVIRVGSIEELFDFATALSSRRVLKGKRIGIVTNAGGPAIMATDALVSVGLDIPRLGERTTATLRKNLVDEASVKNPVDMTAHGNPQMYDVAMDAVLKDRNIDALLTIFVPPSMVDEVDIANTIVKVSKRHKKTIMSCFLGTTEESPGFAKLALSGIPTYLFPESAAKALASLYNYGKYLSRETGQVKKFRVNKRKARKILERARNEGRQRLWEGEVSDVLSAYGFSVARGERATNFENAKQIAEEIGYPVALKGLSREIFHKSDYNAVALDIEDEKELKKKFNQIRRSIEKHGFKVAEYLVQEMVRGGKETIMGMKLDRKFGPLLMFGLGGIYVEVLKDVVFRLTPLTDADARRMISAIKSYPLLAGVRGEKGADINCLVDHLQRISQLVSDFQELEELDMNPVVVFERGKGCKIVDARMTISLEPTKKR